MYSSFPLCLPISFCTVSVSQIRIAVHRIVNRAASGGKRSDKVPTTVNTDAASIAVLVASVVCCTAPTPRVGFDCNYIRRLLCGSSLNLIRVIPISVFDRVVQIFNPELESAFRFNLLDVL